MGKYSIHDDPRVDEYIDEYLKKIVNIIIKNMPEVSSIILAGSFGKGEGSVLIEGQSIKPLRDLDLVIVFRKTPPAKVIINLQKKLRNRFCYTRADDDYPLVGDIIPEIKDTILENINSLPDIFTYDLKKCHVIYGEDIRSKIKWSLKDLPLRTNARALFQKAIALIGIFHTKYLNKEIPYYLKDSFLREASRAYIEICTGLCLLAKKYDVSCIQRLEVVKKIYQKEFPVLYERIPDLVYKIESSTKYKLDPYNNRINVDLLDYWFKTREDLGEMIKYYMSEYLNLSFNNWPQFSTSLEKRLTNEYYIPVIKAYLENRNLPSNYFMTKFCNILYNIKENIEYSKADPKNKYLYIPLIKGISAPAIKVFSTAPLILYSVNREGNMNSEYIDISLKKLKFIKLENREYENAWEEARAKFLKLVFSVNLI